MGLRFSRRIKIAPGISINLGLNGISASVGTRGASVNLSKRGVRGTLGVSGTGLSYSQNLSSRAKKRAINQEQKKQKEQERLAHLSQVTLKVNQADGSLLLLDNYGQEIQGRDKTLIFDTKSALIAEWLQERADEINGDVELLQDIFLDAPNIEIPPCYQKQDYSIPSPIAPIKPSYPRAPIKENVAEINFFANFFRCFRRTYEEKVRQADENFQQAIKQWQMECASIDQQYEANFAHYKEQLVHWKKNRIQHEINEIENEGSFKEKLRADLEFMDEMLVSTIERMEWPRETTIEYQIVKDKVWLDVDLPEIEDLPQKIASVSVTGRKLNIKNKSKKQLQTEYSQHIHGIGLRLACFVLSSLPSIQQVIVSGFSQRVNSATGKINDDYLYSTKFTRKGLQTLDFNNLEKIDPVATHGLFEMRRKLAATGIFKPIQPFKVS